MYRKKMQGPNNGQGEDSEPKVLKKNSVLVMHIMAKILKVPKLILQNLIK